MPPQHSPRCQPVPNNSGTGPLPTGTILSALLYAGLAMDMVSWSRLWYVYTDRKNGYPRTIRSSFSLSHRSVDAQDTGRRTKVLDRRASHSCSCKGEVGYLTVADGQGVEKIIACNARRIYIRYGEWLSLTGLASSRLIPVNCGSSVSTLLDIGETRQ